MTEPETTKPTVSNAALAVQTVGQQLLGALVEEIRNLRTHWAVTPQQQQEEIIDRLSDKVQIAVTRAVGIIAKDTFLAIPAHIESVTFKDGVKTVLTASKSADGRHELADAEGSDVLVLVTDPQKYLEHMETIRGDKDQPELPGLAA